MPDVSFTELAGRRVVLRRFRAADVAEFVAYYNEVRLHSAIGYVTPKDMLAGRQVKIHTERDRKLEAARQQRQNRRQQAV